MRVLTPSPRSAAEQKATLLAAGAGYRQGLLQAKAGLTVALHTPPPLQQALLYGLGLLASRLIGSRLAGGRPLPGLLPLVLTVGSYLSRKRWLAPMLAVGVLAALLVRLSGRRQPGRAKA